jgi:hypothetical protein
MKDTKKLGEQVVWRLGFFLILGVLFLGDWRIATIAGFSDLCATVYSSMVSLGIAYAFLAD